MFNALLASSLDLCGMRGSLPLSLHAFGAARCRDSMNRLTWAQSLLPNLRTTVKTVSLTLTKLQPAGQCHWNEIGALPLRLQDAVHYAYFAPYTLDDHMALVSELQSDDRVRLQVLGETLDGHDIDMLQIGDQSDPCCPVIMLQVSVASVPSYDDNLGPACEPHHHRNPVQRPAGLSVPPILRCQTLTCYRTVTSVFPCYDFTVFHSVGEPLLSDG